ncbi:MAG: DUF1467 family protein [Maritimibacter sp.]|jgi:predicted secreted protein
MSITAGTISFVIIWFITMFVVTAIGNRSQAEDGEVVPGTHEGAPANFRVGRTLLITTLWAALVWALIAIPAAFGLITMDMLSLIQVVE